jgi:integrase
MAAPYIVKGEKRGRPGRWIVDYRDPHGERKWKTFKTQQAAEQYRDNMTALLRGLTDDDSEYFNSTFTGYATHRWLPLVKVTAKKPRTHESYADMVRVHLIPAFGRMLTRDLTRKRIHKFLIAKLSSGLKHGTVRVIYAALRRLLSVAVNDGLFLANPAAKLGRELRLEGEDKRTRQEQIKAFTTEQLQTFLKAVERVHAAYVPFFVTLALTGMRLGEALGLQWDDLNSDDRTIRVQHALSQGRVETPKSGHGRTVDMADTLVTILQRVRLRLPERMKRHKWSEMPPWVFCTRAGTPLEPHNVRKVFRKCLRAAGLPRHFTPHSLRHTFASVLLQEGESVQYVQEQLGHASHTMTVDTYGKWLPKKPIRGGVNLLGDLLRGSKPGSRVPGRALKPLQKRGEPSGIRTLDPLIKSQVLYRLS